MSEQNIDGFLFGGAKSATFPTIGTSITGTVSAPPELQQQRDMKTGDVKKWEDGNPMMQMVITLDTDERDREDPDDDGSRRLFVKSGMKAAVARAVKAAGATRIEVGGKLTVKYTADGKQERRGFSAPKIYEASYSRPADAALGVEQPAATETRQEAPQAAAAASLSPEALAALKGLGLA